jgi:hypothetical protein
VVRIDSIRQGDVAFFRLDKIPVGYERVKQNLLEIRGEGGGHIHRIEGVEVYRNAGSVAVAEKEGYDLPLAVIRAFGVHDVVHDVLRDDEKPHPNQFVPPGIWEVRRARQRVDDRTRRAD